MPIRQFFVPKDKFIFCIHDQRITGVNPVYLTEILDEDCETRMFWLTEAQLFGHFQNRNTKIIYDNFLTWYHQDRYSNIPDYFHTNLSLHQHRSLTPSEFRLVPDAKFFKGHFLALLESFIEGNKFSFQQGFLDEGTTDRLINLLGFWDDLKLCWSPKDVPYYIYPHIITFKSVLENNGRLIKSNDSETMIHCLLEPYLSQIQGLDKERRKLFVVQFANPVISPNYGLCIAYGSRGKTRIIGFHNSLFIQLRYI